MTSGTDLGALLALLPRLARLDGRPVAEVAAELGMSEARLMSRMRLLSGLRYGELDEGEVVDCWVEQGRLFVYMGVLLDRVIRLSSAEMQALLLGAARLRRRGPLAGERSLTGLLERIEEALGEMEGLRASALLPAAEDEDVNLVLVRRALKEQRVLRMWYYSTSSDRYRLRDVDVLSCFRHRGHDYMQAFDRLSGEPRTFRIDRIGEATLTDEAARQVDPALVPPVQLHESHEVQEADLLLTGAFARMAQEQGWSGLEAADEGLRWRPRYSRADSLLRALLPQLGSFRVLGPPGLLADWQALLREMRLRHTGPY